MKANRRFMYGVRSTMTKPFDTFDTIRKEMVPMGFGTRIHVERTD